MSDNPTIISGGRVSRTDISGGRVTRTQMSGGQVLRTDLSGGVAPVSSAPVYTGPPIFAGIDMFYLTPSDLVGTIALGDPITDLPAQGGLITGNFSAAGTARPILQDDGTGRIGAFFDGVDDMPAISGLSLDFSVTGMSVFAVMRPTWTSGVRGVFVAGTGPAPSQHYAESNVSTYSAGNHNMTVAANRGATLGFYVSGNVFPVSGLSSYGGIFGAAESGVYDDGALIAGGALDLRPVATITNMYLAGFSLGKFQGHLFELVGYRGALDAGQRTTLRDYLRTKWNGGSPF